MRWQMMENAPDDDRYVLVLYKDETGLEQVCRAFRDGDKWASFDTATFIQPIYWMLEPLPPNLNSTPHWGVVPSIPS